MFDLSEYIDDKNLGYKALSQIIIEAIESGQLAANSPLPPSRVLASSLGVSRDTVMKCYKHLKSLGWITSFGTRGTFISRAETREQPPARPLKAGRLSSYGLQFLTETEDIGHRSPAENPDSTGEPVVFSAVPPQFLPIRRWRMAMQKTTETVSSREPLYDLAVLGRPELRGALSSFLNHNRGIPCVPDEIGVFNVSFNALTLICRLFLEPGDVIAMEEPGFGGVREAAFYLGLKVVPVEVDKDGMVVEQLDASAEPIKLIYVTPNHHEPTGAIMSLARRKQLLSWAQRHNATIIEDDYDGLFDYGTRLPPSLKSMDAQDNVIFLASFWQLLYPLTTLCFAIFPLALLEIIRQAKQRTVSLTESSQQLALTELLTDGYLQKHVRKLEREFGARRQTFIFELKKAFGSRVSLPSQTCGLTVMARFQGYEDAELSVAARAAQLPMVSTDVLYADVGKRNPGEWAIYFPGLDQRDIRKAVQIFALTLKANH